MILNALLPGDIEISYAHEYMGEAEEFEPVEFQHKKLDEGGDEEASNETPVKEPLAVEEEAPTKVIEEEAA